MESVFKKLWMNSFYDMDVEKSFPNMKNPDAINKKTDYLIV